MVKKCKTLKNIMPKPKKLLKLLRVVNQEQSVIKNVDNKLPSTNHIL